MPLSRRHFFFGSLALPAFAAKKPTGEQPNILLLLADGLPAWVLGCYGNREVLTPNIDKLSLTGIRFLNNVAGAPLPGPSRVTLLTGRNVLQLHEAAAVPEGETGIDKILSAEGYAVQNAEGSQSVEIPPAGKPFFLTVLFRFQAPYDGVPEKFQAMYAGAKLDTFDREPVSPNASRDKEMLAAPLPSQRKAAAAVSALDAGVGAVMANLAERKLLDSTLVILTSTCGSLLGRHGLWGFGDASTTINMFEEVVAPPLIVSWQGRIPTQGVRPELVTPADFVPTVCELTGADLPSRNLMGRNFLPLAMNKPLPKKQPWRTFAFASFQGVEMAHGDRYKLIQRDGGKGPNELYDLRTDPREKINQYANPQFLTVKTSLAGELAKWKQRSAS